VKYDPNKHHRRSTRLKNYDYTTPGAYFITICTYRRECLFGEIINGSMQLNKLGQIVLDEWLRSVEIRQEIGFDAWVIMPNHFHGIIVINPATLVGANGRSPLQGMPSKTMKPRSLSSFIAGFKSITTQRINIVRNLPRVPVWQRNYYDRIIRDQAALQQIRQYIDNNPLSWQQDQLHPDRLPQETEA
jgi:putative transposase